MEFMKQQNDLQLHRKKNEKERAKEDGGESKDGDSDNYDAERKRLQVEANKEVAKIMKAEQKELAKVRVVCTVHI